jgi:DNA-binding response OmpR family regulator
MGAIAASNTAASPRVRAILVVEDEVLIRLVLADTLRDAGYAVVEAANGDEALAVLTSSTMPGSLDGVGLGRYVRSTRPGLKVIIVSGRTAPTATVDAADAFLSKPYEPAHLLAAIDLLLSDRP